MALDSTRARRWAIQTLQADATLTNLIAGGMVYRDDIPRSADTRTKPGLAVSIQTGGTPIGVIRTGPSTHLGSPVVLKVKAVQQTNSALQIEAVLDRVITLLDGKSRQPITGGGTLHECLKAGDLPFDEVVGDVTYHNHDVFFETVVKA